MLGSRDDRVASYAVELVHTYTFPTIVITGGEAHRNDLLGTNRKERNEAAHFEKVMRRSGVDQSVLLETDATYTGQNARYTYRLLESRNISPKSILILTKPYMERRALATFEAQWPDKTTELLVSSPRFPALGGYIDQQQSIDTVLNIIIGDMQRIIEYSKLGYQSRQDVPPNIVAAFELLIKAGYTKHLIAKK